MTIRREDVDAGRIDFSGVVDTTAPDLPPVHPGEILKEEFLEPLGMSVYALAAALQVPRTRLNDIVLGRRSVTAETALRLAKYFGTSADFWMGLQAQYDLDVARRTFGPDVDRQVRPRAA
jgi:addiction module HigA family antidote